MLPVSEQHVVYDYLRAGFRVLPIWHVLPGGTCACPQRANCKTPGKHPHSSVSNGVHGATSDTGVVDNWMRRHPNVNWAVAAGHPLPNGGWLAIVDIDPRNGGDEEIGRLWNQHGSFPLTPTCLTGGGGQHYYFRSPIEPVKRTMGPGIDFMGIGGYVLLPPSIHASGNSYEWDAGAHFADTPIAPLPGWMVSDEENRPRPSWTGRSARDSIVGVAFKLAGLAGVDLPEGRVAVKCPWFGEHSDGRGDGKDASTVILPPFEGSNFGSFSCKHSHCAHRKWGDVVRVLPMEAIQEAQAAYPQHVKTGATIGVEIDTRAVDPAAVAITPVRELLKWKHTKNGAVVIADGVNAMTILTHDPCWQGIDGRPLLQFDEFLREIRFVRDPPWYADDKPLKQERVWTEDDGVRMHLWLKRKYEIEMAPDKCYQYAKTVAGRWSYHPVREYLEGLDWDGEGRLTDWLTTYMGAPADDYHRLVGRYWMISAVARVMQPGCKADSMLILEGSQGIGKSTALEILAVEREWFSDTPFVIGDKDSYLGLRGKLIVELAELEAMNKAESDRQKAFFSANSDSYRQPYDRKTATIPRQCVFAGTTNQTNYLRDETGARRFWPVECNRIDLDMLRRDRDQLWGEARKAYDRHERWFPSTDAERALLADVQLTRTRSDLWESLIAGWLDSTECGELIRQKNYVTLADIVDRAIRVPTKDQDHGIQIRVGQIMGAMRQWEKRRRRNPVTKRQEWGFSPVLVRMPAAEPVEVRSI